MRAVDLVSCAVVVMLLLITHTAAFSFDLPARSFRCFTEEVPTGVEFNLTYGALPGYGQHLDVKVTDPNNKIIHEDIATDRGHFYMGPESRGGDYAVCFYSRMVPGLYPTEGMHRAVRMAFRVGQDNIDYDKLASDAHMKPMEVHLRVAEDTIRDLHAAYEYFKERENEMRGTSEHMNTKVAVMDAVLIVVFALFAWWQARHLTKHFKRKRMID